MSAAYRWQYAAKILFFPLLVVYGCKGGEPRGVRATGDATEEGTAPVVLIGHPKVVDVEESITLAGSIEPYEQTTIYARVTGYIDKLHVDIGDVVQKGDVLAELTVPEMRYKILESKADVAKAFANRKLAEVTHQRLVNLHKAEPGAVTEQDVDLAAAQLDVARAEVDVAEARLNRLRTMATFATIRSPFAGVVTNRFVDSGALIEGGATVSSAVVEVMRVDKLRLVFDVPDVISPFIEPGTQVSFFVDAYPGDYFEAKVARCATVNKPATRTMRVEADIEGSTLRAGMYATVRISYRETPDALTLPASALRMSSDGPGVFAVLDGVVHRIPLTILQDNGAEIVVRGDLGPGTNVILAGPSLLSEGQVVRVREGGGKS